MQLSKKHIAAGTAALFLMGIALQNVGMAQAEKPGYNQADCPTIVKQAIDTANAECAQAGRNKLCYGNTTLTVQFQTGSSSLVFHQPGDIVDVSQIKQLTLSGMDTTANIWGVAEMKIQANLPDTDPTQAVTMILFGDVQMTDGDSDANTAVLTLTPGAIARQNQYATATTNAINQQVTKSGATATKIVGLEGTATAHAMTPTPTGTVSAFKATQAAATATKLANLIDTATAAPIPQTPVPGSVSGPYQGLQAFYFQSGDTAPCDQAPHDGILIQSPQGKQRVTLSIDGATISLGSTVYLTAQPGKFLTVNTLEGSAIVTAAGQTQTAGAGSFLQVPLDANLRASGAPTASGFYRADAVRALPTRNLPNTTVAFASGLPANVTVGAWTSVYTPTSVTGAGCNQLAASTVGSILAYNDTTMWYNNIVLTNAGQGNYVGTITLPSPTDSTGIYVDTYTLSVIGPTHVSGTRTDVFTNRTNTCTWVRTDDITQNAAP